MEIVRSAKYRLYPSAKQKSLLHNLFGSTRFTYNLFLGKIQESYFGTSLNKKTGELVPKIPSEFDLSKALIASSAILTIVGIAINANIIPPVSAVNPVSKWKKFLIGSEKTYNPIYPKATEGNADIVSIRIFNPSLFLGEAYSEIYTAVITLSGTAITSATIVTHKLPVKRGINPNISDRDIHSLPKKKSFNGTSWKNFKLFVKMNKKIKNTIIILNPAIPTTVPFIVLSIIFLISIVPPISLFSFTILYDLCKHRINAM